jgi:DNA-binding NarL/FixJ family response regulator
MNVYLIDSHPLVREAMAIQIHRLMPEATIQHARDLVEFSSLSKKGPTPELVVTELNLPDAQGLCGLAQIKTLYGKALIVVYSMTSAEMMKDAILATGANAFIPKTATVSETIASLKAILPQDKMTASKASEDIKLSKRQTQLIWMLQEGLNNRDIATKIGLSEHTIKVHLWRLFQKLGVNSRTQALHFCRTNGLI